MRTLLLLDIKVKTELATTKHTTPIMDTPNQRFLKIGKTNIGLIGLDPAIGYCLDHNIEPADAVSYIFDAIQSHNYIPEAATTRYKDAILKEYERRISGETISRDTLEIRVFGSGCVTCDKLASQIFDTLGKFNLVADIEKIFDMDEIWRHGVLTTPALMINGEILCQGKMPTPAEIAAWLGKAAQA